MPPGEVQPRTVQQHIARLAPLVRPREVCQRRFVVFLRRCCGIVSRKFFLTFLLRTAYSGIRRSEPPRAVAVFSTRALYFGAGFFFHLSKIINHGSVFAARCRDRYFVVFPVEVLKVCLSILPALRSHFPVPVPRVRFEPPFLLGSVASSSMCAAAFVFFSNAPLLIVRPSLVYWLLSFPAEIAVRSKVCPSAPIRLTSCPRRIFPFM